MTQFVGFLAMCFFSSVVAQNFFRRPPFNQVYYSGRNFGGFQQYQYEFPSGGFVRPNEQQQTFYYERLEPQRFNTQTQQQQFQPSFGSIESRFGDASETPDYTHLSLCRISRSEFLAGNSQGGDLCFVPDRLVVRRLSYNGRPFWCLGFYKDFQLNSGGVEFADVQLSTGYKVEYSPAEADLQKILPFRVRFRLIPGTIVQVVFFENVNGFPDITSVEQNGETICPVSTDRIRDQTLTPIYLEPPTTLPTIIATRPISFQPLPSTTQPPTKSPIISRETSRPKCGKRVEQILDRIINAQISEVGKWPWHVALYHIVERNLKYKCGGTIVSQRAILTAAHCLVEQGRIIVPERIMVHLGKYILQKFSPETREHEISSMDIHPYYDRTTFKNDIAILKVATLIEYSDYIQPVCLPSADTSLVNRVGQMAGWGRTETGQVATQLRDAGMKLVSFSECLESHRDFFGQVLNDGNFCAGYRNGTSACVGDSGGGLFFQQSRGGAWLIGGIVSLGEGSNGECGSTHYTVFTDVTKYLEWVNERL